MDESINDATHGAGNDSIGQPEQPSGLRHIFIGRDGLRAGWSLLIFIAIMAPLGLQEVCRTGIAALSRAAATR